MNKVYIYRLKFTQKVTEKKEKLFFALDLGFCSIGFSIVKVCLEFCFGGSGFC